MLEKWKSRTVDPGSMSVFGSDPKCNRFLLVLSLLVIKFNENRSTTVIGQLVLLRVVWWFAMLPINTLLLLADIGFKIFSAIDQVGHCEGLSNIATVDKS